MRTEGKKKRSNPFPGPSPNLALTKPGELSILTDTCVALPMVTLLSVFYSWEGITNAKNFVEDLDCCPKARPAAKISAVLSSKKGTSRSGL